MNTSHVKKLWLCTLLLFAGRFLMAQTTIVQWNFNSPNSNAYTFTVPANSTAPGPSLGTGNLNLIGGVNGFDVNGIMPDDGTNSMTNRALNTTGYPAIGQPANRKTAGIVISTSTAGYNSIQLAYYSQHSNTAANTVVIQYLSGNTWIDFGSYVVNSNTFPQRTFDLSGITALNNNSNAQIRVVTDFGNSTNYTGTNGTYASGGTIRYDRITISGNPTSCGTSATQQATGLRLLKTDNSSAQLTLNRGNGTGCLVICSANNLPNTAPVSGTNYAANSTFGSGPAVGNAFAVYNTQVNNPTTHYFNINGLTAGTKYYVAAYEYSSTGYCYLTPGTVDSFYCNSTILYPGDVQFVGFDNNDSSGRDVFVLTNLKTLKPGTNFQIVNSRFEAGAAANVRTNRWYAGSNLISDDIQSILITYDGSTDLPAGSIISFRELGTIISTIQINGISSSNLKIIPKNVVGTASVLSGTAPEQFFITQGKFTVYNPGTSSQYSLLDGHVLHGISYPNNWIDFSQACSSGSQSINRTSRLPSDIKCLNLSFNIDPATSNGYAYYSTGQHSGSQSLLIGQLNDISKWAFGNGTNALDIPSYILTTQFYPNTTQPIANWTGSNGTNWFNCTNWENLYVPDSTADVTIATTPVATIDANGTSAAEYGNVATSRALNVTNTINLSGNSANKLMVYDSLFIGNTGILASSGSATDTVVVRGNIRTLNPNGLQLSTNGWLALHGNRQLQPINVSLESSTLPVGVNALSLNNPPGININSGGFESLIKLELANGILSPVTANAFHYMGAACTINSPINLYNETNKGWEKSYIDGKVFVRTNANTSYTAPLGSKQKGVFAPMLLYPAGTTSTVYEAGYVGMSHPNTGSADINNPPITKVSTQEYWTLVSNPTNMAASLTLYYTPLSFVGGPQGTDPQALTDLRIVQYWDSSAGSPRKWRYPTFPISFNAGPTVQYGKISMSQYATSLNDADRSFTLGSGQGINTLPVKIIHWIARLQGNRTQLTWQVQQETGTAFYVVEKSMDGKAFRPLQTVYAAGLPTYAYYDDSPADGWNYYRLKVTDLDGKTSYTAVEKVWLKQSNATFVVFPNPATDKVFITLPFTAKATLNLYAPDGRKCMTQNVVNTSFTQLTVKGLPTGWYMLEYTDSKNRLTQKLMIK